MLSKRVLSSDYMIYKFSKRFDEIAVYNGSEYIKKEKKEAISKYHRDHSNKFLNYVIDKFGISKSLFKYRVKDRSTIKKNSYISATID
jgi:hypothetical protein